MGLSVTFKVNSVPFVKICCYSFQLQYTRVRVEVDHSLLSVIDPFSGCLWGLLGPTKHWVLFLRCITPVWFGVHHLMTTFFRSTTDPTFTKGLIVLFYRIFRMIGFRVKLCNDSEPCICALKHDSWGLGKHLENVTLLISYQFAHVWSVFSCTDRRSQIGRTHL